MAKLSNVIANLLRSDKTVLRLMKDGLVNLSAFAEKIKADVDNQTGSEVSESAIVMAIRRFLKSEEALQNDKEKNEEKLPYDVVMTGGIFALDIEASGEKTRDNLTRFSRIIGNTDDFLNITESGKEISIITSEKNRVLCLEIFKNEKQLSKQAGLSCLVVTFSSGFFETEGVLYKAIKRLFFEDINIYEIYSTYNKVIFVVSESNAVKAYEVLKDFL